MHRLVCILGNSIRPAREAGEFSNSVGMLTEPDRLHPLVLAPSPNRRSTLCPAVRRTVYTGQSLASVSTGERFLAYLSLFELFLQFSHPCIVLGERVDALLVLCERKT